LISWTTVGVLVGLGALSYRADHQNYSWWVWAGLITVMNVLTIRQQQAPDYPAIPASRWAMSLLAGLMLVLTVTISPFQIAASLRS